MGAADKMKPDPGNPRKILPRTVGIGIDFFLNLARDMGAVLVGAKVREICHTQSQKHRLTLLTHSGETRVIESDFLAICTGVNPGSCVSEKKVFGSHEGTDSRFVLPKLRQALVFELRTGRDYLRKYMSREIYFIVSGSKKPDLDHITLVPKRDYLTVSLVGKSIDQIEEHPSYAGLKETTNTDGW